MSILRLCIVLGSSLVAELLEEATLSGRLCERKDDWDCVELESMAAEGWYDGAWNDWRLEDPRSLEFPRVHRAPMDAARMDVDIRPGQTIGRVQNGIRPLKPPAMIHGSMVANGAKLFLHWTKSWLGWRPA